MARLSPLRAVPEGRNRVCAQFRIRMAPKLAEKKREIPGKSPGLSAVLARRDVLLDASIQARVIYSVSACKNPGPSSDLCPTEPGSMKRPGRVSKPDGYLLGSYPIATAPEPNSSQLTSFKSTCFDSPANNVGPWPASLGCTTNSYSSINPSCVNASGSFTPPASSPLPDSRLSC
jgi:hypothetical protein